MEKSLLERAKAVPLRIVVPIAYSDEEIELALGWLSGEIQLVQFSKVMFPNKKAAGSGGQALYAISKMLKEALGRGKLSISK